MIIRNAVARQCRQTLASPAPRSILRQLSTQSAALVTDDTPPAGAVLSTPQAITPATKIVAATKKRTKSQKELAISLGFDSAQEHTSESWSTATVKNAQGLPMSPAELYAEFLRVRKNTRKLGSSVKKRYNATALFKNPPPVEDVTLELLMASQTHLGHNTSIWNPSNARYIYGVRQGVHVISLETTAAHLRRAARVVEQVAYDGGVILFVGTRNGQMEIATKAAELAGACHLFTKWTPGGITNRDIILSSHESKIVDPLDNELPGFDEFKSNARPLLPDLVVCLNPLENYTLLYECGLADIPTIGVVDTNVDPSWVTYTIPANDDSLRSVGLIAGVLGNAGGKGNNRRLQDAAKGNVSWATSPTLTRHITKEIKNAVTTRKEVMGRTQTKVQGFNEEEIAMLNSNKQAKEIKISEEDLVGIMGETSSVQGKSKAKSKSKETSTSTSTSGAQQITEIQERLAEGAKVVAEAEAVLKAAKTEV